VRIKVQESFKGTGCSLCSKTWIAKDRRSI